MRRLTRPTFLFSVAFTATAVTAAATGAFTSGCSSFEASPSPPDAATSDDATTLDAGVAESSAETGPLTDAGPAFCTTIDAAFCADFETPPVELGWELPIQYEGMVAATTGGTAGSGHALRVVTTPATGTVPPGHELPDGDGGKVPFQSALLFHDFPIPDSTVVFEGDIFIEEMPPYPKNALLSAFAINGPNGTTSVALLFRNHGAKGAIDAVLAVEEGAGAAHQESVAPLGKSVQQWFHARIVLDRTSTGQARLAIDDVPTAVVSPTTVFTGLPKLRISAGIVRVRDTTTDAIRYDNVVLRTE